MSNRAIRRISFIFFILFIGLFIGLSREAFCQELVWQPYIRVDSNELGERDQSPKVVITDQGSASAIWKKVTISGEFLLVRQIMPDITPADTITGPVSRIDNFSATSLDADNLVVCWQYGTENIHSRIYESTSDTWRESFTLPNSDQTVSMPFLHETIDGNVWLIYFHLKSTWTLICRQYVDLDGNGIPEFFSDPPQEIASLSSIPIAPPAATNDQDTLWVSWTERDILPSEQYRIKTSSRVQSIWSEPADVFQNPDPLTGLSIASQNLPDQTNRLWLVWTTEFENRTLEKQISVSHCENCDDSPDWTYPDFLPSQSLMNDHPTIVADNWGLVWIGWTSESGNRTIPDDDVIFGFWKDSDNNSEWEEILERNNPMINIGDDHSPFFAHDQKELLVSAWIQGSDVYAAIGNMRPDCPLSGFYPGLGEEVATQSFDFRCDFPPGPEELQKFAFFAFSDNVGETFISLYGENAVRVELGDNKSYSYRVQTLDSEELNSEWTSAMTFYVNSEQEPPLLTGDLTVDNLQEGVVDTNFPRFRWEVPTDADPLDDETTISFELQIDASFAFDSTDLLTFPIPEQRESYQISQGLPEDSQFFARLRAIDRTGLVSNWMPIVEFFVNRSNDAPTVGLLSPQGGEIFSGLTSIEWETSDSESDSLIVGLEVSLDDGDSWSQLPNVDERGISLSENRGDYAVDFNKYESSHQARIRITVTDFPGFASTIQTSGSFTISNQTFNCLPRVISPNSANNETQISFTLEKSADVSLKIYSLAGKLKRVLIQEQFFNNGSYTKRWDGRDADNGLVPPRPYLCVLSINDGEQINIQRIKILVTPK